MAVDDSVGIGLYMYPSYRTPARARVAMCTEALPRCSRPLAHAPGWLLAVPWLSLCLPVGAPQLPAYPLLGVRLAKIPQGKWLPNCLPCLPSPCALGTEIPPREIGPPRGSLPTLSLELE